MILYNFLTIMSAAACGLAGFLSLMHFRLWKSGNGLGRRLEGSYAMVKAGWSMTTGTILWILITSNRSVATPVNLFTLMYLFGLGVSSVGMSLLLRPTVDRVVDMETHRRDEISEAAKLPPVTDVPDETEKQHGDDS